MNENNDTRKSRRINGPKDKKVFQNRTRLLSYIIYRRKVDKINFNRCINQELGLSNSTISEELNFLIDSELVEDKGHYYKITKKGENLLQHISVFRTLAYSIMFLILWLIFRVSTGFIFGGIPLVSPMVGGITVIEMVAILLVFVSISWKLYRYPLIFAKRKRTWMNLNKEK